MAKTSRRAVIGSPADVVQIAQGNAGTTVVVPGALNETAFGCREGLHTKKQKMQASKAEEEGL